MCQFGSVKSAISRELLRLRAAERGIEIVAFSRGITPGGQPSPALATMLRAEQIDPTADPLQRLRQEDLDEADLLIFFDKPSTLGSIERYRDWSDVGSMNSNYPAARIDVMSRIDRLLDELSRR